jgi:hypothetical protein
VIALFRSREEEERREEIDVDPEEHHQQQFLCRVTRSFSVLSLSLLLSLQPSARIRCSNPLPHCLITDSSLLRTSPRRPNCCIEQQQKGNAVLLILQQLFLSTHTHITIILI